MNFDQMLESWRTQDTAPLYEVNLAALRQALQTEEATVRRVRRRDMLIVCIVGPGVAVFAALWLGVLIYQGKPAIYIIAAGLSFGMIVPWVGAYCVSRWRQAKRERNFGSTLQEEVRRNLSRIDYEISQSRHWSTVIWWIAPIMVGAMLLNWSVAGSQRDGPGSFFSGWSYIMIAGWMFYLVRWAGRYAKENSNPASDVCASCSPPSRAASDRDERGGHQEGDHLISNF